jgi:HlyD family secretion protein
MTARIPRPDGRPARALPLDRLLESKGRNPLVVLAASASVLFSAALVGVSWHRPFNPLEQRRELAGTIFTGTIGPSEEVAVTAPQGGTVSQRWVRIGDHVTSGQLLLSLDDRDARLAVNESDLEEWSSAEQVQKIRYNLAVFDEARSSGKQGVTEAAMEVSLAQRQAEQVPGRQWRDSPERAQAAVDQATQRWERATRLRQGGLISDQDMEDARISLRIAQDDLANARRYAEAALALERAQERQASMETDRAGREQKRQRNDLEAQLDQALVRHSRAVTEHDQAHRRLSDTSLRAPGPGVVVALLANVGEKVTPAQPLVRIASLESLLVHIQVSAQLVNVLHPHQPVLVHLPTVPPRQVEGGIVAINPIPVANMTHAVDVQFPNPTGVLLVGQPAEVSVLSR